MNKVLCIVDDALKKTYTVLSAAWSTLTSDQLETIVDQYKGMEIRIRARRFGLHAWRCSIRIGNAPHQALQSIVATLYATDDGISRQVALTGAFIEAMALCDLLLERRALQQ